MAAAIFGTCSNRAVWSGETGITNTLAIYTLPLVAAVSGAVGHTAVRSTKSRVTHTLSVLAAALVIAVIQTLICWWTDSGAARS